jgi:methionyl-tRNA synthetase
MLAAEKAGMAPEAFIKGIQVSHERDFGDFGVAHDYYYTTHSPENRELAEMVYQRLRDAKPSHIATKSVRQFYDPVKQMFLPDRYIKGECPNCGTLDQYGDNCENCGATYAPTDLKNPYSVVSGAAPELRDSEHYFFKVGDFAPFLREWLAGEHTHGNPVMHPSVAAKLREWLDSEGGVRDWDISRDAPYFGFEIPGTDGKKFFYVWLDAPIGYLASFKKYCASEPGASKGLTAATFDEFLQVDNAKFDRNAEMHHFIGKDIINFHGLFWPAMLKGARLRAPVRLYVNGYLMVNGAKMSKTRGTFIQARTYLNAGLNPEYLRYYFATMLDDTPKDIDLDLKAFEERVNSHLVGKFVNLASRASNFITQMFSGRLYPENAPRIGATLDLDKQILRDASDIKKWYEQGNFSFVAKTIMANADDLNKFWNDQKPWLLAKDSTRHAHLHSVASETLRAFYRLAVCIFPLCPELSLRALELFGATKAPAWTDLNHSPVEMKPFTELLKRVDPRQVEAMVEWSKETLAATPSPPIPPLEGEGLKARNASAPRSAPPSPTSESAAASSPVSPLPSPVSIDDFAKLDLRIGTVLQCEFVDGSDKLLRFELDAGDLGKRQIFSGIRAAYQEPAKLVGRKVVFIANLAPRKMRFGVSEGMILSAGDERGLFLLDVDGGAEAGMPVK